MYGWWRTFEHFSEPGSAPVSTSADLGRVYSHVNAVADIVGKEAVVAELVDNWWRIIRVVALNGLSRELSSRQALKYESARAGGSRGNLGGRPSLAETAGPSVDLDKQRF